MKPFVYGLVFILGLGAISQACDQCQRQAAVGQPVGVCQQAVQAVQPVQAAPLQAFAPAQTYAMPVQTYAMPMQTYQTVQTVQAMPVQTVQTFQAVQQVQTAQFVNACMSTRRGVHPLERAVERRNERVDARRSARQGGCHGTAAVIPVALVQPVQVAQVPIRAASCSGSGQPLNATAPQSDLPPTPDLR